MHFWTKSPVKSIPGPRLTAKKKLSTDGCQLQNFKARAHNAKKTTPFWLVVDPAAKKKQQQREYKK